MAKIRYWLLKLIRCRRFSFCSSRRESLRSSGKGFTLVEIILVVAILAIAAVMVIPMISSGAEMQLRSAADIVAADLEYAKSMAISRGQNFSVVFDKNTESYRIVDQNDITIRHPVKKGFDYAVDFRSDSRLDKVDIFNVVFEPDASQTITFDSLGSPYSGSGITPLNSGVITLKAGSSGSTITVNVEPVTGYISISD